MSVPMSPASICSKTFGNGNAQLIPQVPACWKQILSIIRRNQWVSRQGPFLLRKGSGKQFQDIQVFQGGLFRRQYRGWCQNWYVTSIRMNGKQMEPYIWDTIKPVLEKGFKDQDAEKCSESQWLEHVYKGSNEVRFEYCETSQKALT